MIDRLFLDYSIRKLTQASERVDACLEKLTEDQVWAKGGANENAVGNLVIHVCGNIRQWLLSGVGGQELTRDRDAEFAATGGMSIAALRDTLRRTVGEGIAIIRPESGEALARELDIQNYRVTVLEAIYHVVEHFGAHTGQIIFITKMLTGDDLGFYQHLKYRSHAERTP